MPIFCAPMCAGTWCPYFQELWQLRLAKARWLLASLAVAILTLPSLVHNCLELSCFQTGHANTEKLCRTFKIAIVDLKAGQLHKVKCTSCHLLCLGLFAWQPPWLSDVSWMHPHVQFMRWHWSQVEGLYPIWHHFGGRMPLCWSRRRIYLMHTVHLSVLEVFAGKLRLPYSYRPLLIIS